MEMLQGKAMREMEKKNSSTIPVAISAFYREAF